MDKTIVTNLTDALSEYTQSNKGVFINLITNQDLLKALKYALKFSGYYKNINEETEENFYQAWANFKKDNQLRHNDGYF